MCWEEYYSDLEEARVKKKEELETMSPDRVDKRVKVPRSFYKEIAKQIDIWKYDENQHVEGELLR